MPSGTYIWSQTAASNATSDSAIGWAEGQAPSSVNDSARSMMAVLKKHDDDIAGAIVTGGTSTSYTVTSYSTFDSLAHMSGQVIAFSPHVTNGATVVLNVDGLGAKPLRSSPGVELQAGTLIQGTPYLALYNNSDAAFYLRGFFGNPYNVPLAAGMDYWASTAPNSSFAFPIGQAISRTTYATLFSLISTTYGPGDGTTTFNLPDKTGRVSAMKEASATRLTSTHFGGTSTTLGATGGLESHTLTQAQLPNVSLSSASLSVSLSPSDSVHRGATPVSPFAAAAGGTNVWRLVDVAVATMTASVGGTVPLGGSGAAHNNTPPTIICNYILRII